MGHPILNRKLCSKTTLYHKKLAPFKCNPVKTYFFDIDKNTFEKVIWYLNIWVIWQLYKTEWEKHKKFKTKNINNVWYTAWKLAWLGGCRMRSYQEIKCFWRMLSCLNKLLQDETLMQETKYLASHFCFFGIMLHRNLEYLHILWSANH